MFKFAFIIVLICRRDEFKMRVGNIIAIIISRSKAHCVKFDFHIPTPRCAPNGSHLAGKKRIKSV